MNDENTKNKIFLCWNCYAPQTGDRKQWCNDLCEQAWKEKRKARDMGWVKVFAYLNKSMLDIAAGQGIHPHRFSGFFHTGHDLMAVALYDRPELEQIGDNEMNTYDAYWREVQWPGQLEKGSKIEPYDPDEMRDDGLLSYLQRFEIRTEKQIASAIGLLTEMEGCDDPIHFINTL